MGSCPVDHTFGPLVDTMAEEDSEQVAGQTGRKELGVRSFLHSRERGWWMVEGSRRRRGAGREIEEGGGGEGGAWGT